LNKGGILYISACMRHKGFAWYIYKNKNGYVLDPAFSTVYRSVSDFIHDVEVNGFSISTVRVSPYGFSIIDIIIRVFLKVGFLINNKKIQEIYENHRILAYLRKKIKIPIFGFYSIDIIAIKKKSSSVKINGSVNKTTILLPKKTKSRGIHGLFKPSINCLYKFVD
jgi:hypothetical protein